MAGAAVMAADIPGTAGELVAQLGDRAVLCDLYDELGASVYHEVAGHDTHEVRELLSLVRTVAGPVLDLAAGSGRLTLPLLALGREVTALELSPSMLRLLAERLDAAPGKLCDRCHLVEGDMRTFSLAQRFGVVVLGTTSISLLDEPGRRSMYDAVRGHLAAPGRFLLTTVEVDETYQGPAEIVMEVAVGSGRTYRLFEYVDATRGHRSVTIFPEALDGDRVTVCTTTIGILSADRLTDELTRAGFTVRGRHQLSELTSRLRSVLLEAECAA